MSESKTLLQFLLDLLNNKEALASFRADPQGALHTAGMQNVTVDDVKELLPVVLEKVDPAKCAQYEDDCDADRCHDDAPQRGGSEGHRGEQHDAGRHWGEESGRENEHGRPQQHDSEIDKLVTHLNYVTNNYSYVDNSHDTVFNTSNINKIWAGEGSHISVDNNTVNAGENSTAIGGDNNGTAVSGGHNVVGDHNSVSGDGSTTAFGTGSALSHVGTGDGGAVSVGGPASGNSEHTNFQNYGAGNLTAATHAPATSSTSDSHNITDSQNHTSTDSHNNTDSHNITDSQNHGSFNPDNSVSTDASNHQSFEDSHNTYSDSHDTTATDNSIDNSHGTVTTHDPLLPAL